MKKDLNHILIKPHVTEKASLKSESSVFVFQVAPSSTKHLVRAAFIERYKITPLNISTVTIPAKNVFVRGKKGKKSGYKKAYIYLKPGTKIENL
ncbi:50S ribosomal protein L23 [Patescibacteria group bacterium]|nr:50S ribosomal protein L23 [Patescibacteria group bacterium]